MFEVVSNEEIAPKLHRMVIRAPRVARARKPGQFVIVRVGEGAERIPLTIADDDAAAGTVTLIIQAVGRSTQNIVAVARWAAGLRKEPGRSASPPTSRTSARSCASAAERVRPCCSRWQRRWRLPATI